MLCAGLMAIFLYAQSPPAGDEDKDEPVYAIGGDVSPPKLVYKVDPSHVAGAGTVVIGLVVTSKGLPRDLRVIESMGKDLDNSAMQAVKQWKFEPARKKDQPVAVKVTVEIRFHDM